MKGNYYNLKKSKKSYKQYVRMCMFLVIAKFKRI